MERWAYGLGVGAWLGMVLLPLGAMGCGLDWSLPQAHFAGVEEHGYVAYWETIAEMDLGAVVIPVHIGFNSHREASSPVLGKGWIVALLESHVEPIDENAMNVIMPDGWTFLFLRNANSETWRGNAGWMGETDGARLTITAPCGWRIRYDRGKIQEIEGDEIGSLTYDYNGGVPTEIDHDGAAVLQVERDPVTGRASALVVMGRRIDVALAQRPRVVNLLGNNLLSGFDLSLASLQMPEGRKENFAFGTDKALEPTLTIAAPAQLTRTFVWDAATRQIKSDGDWAYTLKPVADHLRFTRVSAQNGTESFEADDATGLTAEKSADGAELVTYRFVSGPLAGSVRRIEQRDAAGHATPLYAASYFPSGELMRETFYPDTVKMYAESRQMVKETVGGKVVYEQDVDALGRVVHIIDATRGVEVVKSYDAEGNQTAQVFQKRALFYTERIDKNNKLISFQEENQ